MTVFVNKDGEIVSRSKNLRGLTDYARKVGGVRRASVYRDGDGAFVVVIFKNLAESRARFADFQVAKAWVAGRRSWGLTLRGHNDTLADYT